ncbi:hypothetical protein AM593_09942, partial [Mytilus galloprovincialis]
MFTVTVGAQVGDSLDYSSNRRFTRLDRDNVDAKDNCARRHPGAWWYKDCMHSNLNGHYYIKTPVGGWNGIIWYHWKGANHSLKATAMMIRRLYLCTFPYRIPDFTPTTSLVLTLK